MGLSLAALLQLAPRAAGFSQRPAAPVRAVGNRHERVLCRVQPSRVPSSLLPHRLTVTPYLGDDATGAPVYDTPVRGVRARVEPSRTG